MPIYEYACTDCNDKFEKLIRSTARPAEVECPTCGSKHVVKQVSAFAARVSGGSPRLDTSASSCSTGST